MFIEWLSEVRELYVSFGGCGRLGIFTKLDVWERWISIIGDAGIAFPCIGVTSYGVLGHMPPLELARVH